MPLTVLAHKKYRSAAPAANTIEGWLNAIYAALSGNMTYWTVARYQASGVTQALYFTPVGGQALAKNVRILLAGADSGSLTPTMATGSTFANSQLFAGLVIGAGAFDDWTAAAPFTSHDYSSGLNYVKNTGSLTAAAFDIYESAETLQFSGIQNTGGVYASVHLGALIDPESAVAGNGSATADARVYGIYTADYTSLYLWGDAGRAGRHAAGTGQKALYLDASGTWTAMLGVGQVGDANVNLLQADGSPWLTPIYWCEAAGQYRVLGRMRETYFGPKVVHDTDIVDASGQVVAYSLSGDDLTAYTSLCLAT